jgi:DNA-binding LytR/AlgR family response regulator
MTLTCLIIDDEPLARKGLKEYIQEVDFLQLAGEFEDPLKAAPVLLQQKTDLLFLDIQMPKLTGLDFLKTLAHPPLVILTTAYPQYALDGFELNVVDYLLKPFSFERFWKAIVKAQSLASAQSRISLTETLAGPTYFFIKHENKLLKIKHIDILFVEALQNYVAIHVKDKKYLAYLTLQSVEEYLPAEQFLKIHKSYLVAFDKIDGIEGNNVRIAGYNLPVSRNLKDEVMEKLLKGKFLKR